MTKINVKPDCGNLQKAAFIHDFEMAFANGDDVFALDFMSDDIRCELAGYWTKGKEEIIKMLNDIKDEHISEMTIENIITHGDVGTANRSMKFSDGKSCLFCVGR